MSATDARRRYGGLAKNLLTVLVSVSLCTAVAEVALRLTVPDETRPNDSESSFSHRDYMKHDPLFGWRLKPNTEGTLVASEFEVHISINSNGARDPEVSFAKPANERRVLILGDSFAEGYSVDLEERFSGLLERHLNRAAEPGVSVINLGVGGYSTDQQLLLFQNEGTKYEPDIVVLLVYQNDIMANTHDKRWRGSKPVFELAGDDLVLTNIPVPRPEAQADPRSARQSEGIERVSLKDIRTWLYGNSRLYQFVRRVVRDNRSLLALAVKVGVADERALEAIPRDFEILATSYATQTSYAWRLTERIIKELDDSVAEAGASLLIAYAPSRAVVYAEDWDATLRKYGMSKDEWDVDRAAAELAAICERNRVPFLDLTSDLRAAAADLPRKEAALYFERDIHWTREGNAQVAKALARFLEGRL